LPGALEGALAGSLTGHSRTHVVDVAPDTPLREGLRDALERHAAKFGCERTPCGAGTITVEGALVRACSPRSRRWGGRAPHGRGRRPARASPAVAAGLHRGAGGAVRLVPRRDAQGRAGASRRQPARERPGEPRAAGGLLGPLRYAAPHPAGPQARAAGDGRLTHAVALARRARLQAGGAPIVSVGLLPQESLLPVSCVLRPCKYLNNVLGRVCKFTPMRP
jgi:hypothetical protein